MQEKDDCGEELKTKIKTIIQSLNYYSLTSDTIKTSYINNFTHIKSLKCTNKQTHALPRAKKITNTSGNIS